MSEIALGVLPGTGGSQRLTRHIGKARALELMATGRRISFEEAQELGPVHEISDTQARVQAEEKAFRNEQPNTQHEPQPEQEEKE